MRGFHNFLVTIGKLSGLKWTNFAKFLSLGFMYQSSFTICGVPDLRYFSYGNAALNYFTRKKWTNVVIFDMFFTG